MASTPDKTKDPDAVADYTILWSDWLDGDTISASAWTVPAGLTQPFSATNTTTTATVWLGGGTADAAYNVVNHITTTGGRQNDATLRIFIKER